MKTRSIVAVVSFLAVLLTLSCQKSAPPPPAEAELDPAVRAAQLAQEILILDTHIDLPYRLHETPEDVTAQTPDGHFDLVRARRGGLDAA
ncbi:MAG TPA: hypothetical protein VLT32_03145, partial [Candidatus Sulfomarinibacteraceae bacterium]|nr:hypothetical protein [Candidatus Sulfomarinibacteraceae bacterium]